MEEVNIVTYSWSTMLLHSQTWHAQFLFQVLPNVIVTSAKKPYPLFSHPNLGTQILQITTGLKTHDSTWPALYPPVTILYWQERSSFVQSLSASNFKPGKSPI